MLKELLRDGQVQFDRVSPMMELEEMESGGMIDFGRGQCTTILRGIAGGW